MAVEVLENIAGLRAVFGGSSSLSINERAQMRDTAVLLTSFVVSVALVADEITVSAVSF